MGPVAEAVVQRVQDQIPFDIGDGPPDKFRGDSFRRCAARLAPALAGSAQRLPSGMRIASTPISSPLASSMARCMVFSNSRTLPGHGLDHQCAALHQRAARTGTPFFASSAP
jgi:hypothetical protein